MFLLPISYNLRNCHSVMLCLVDCYPETPTESLRSILAQLEYAYVVREYVKQGVQFDQHLYVPEMHPVTKAPFCEREDETHVLKV